MKRNATTLYSAASRKFTDLDREDSVSVLEAIGQPIGASGRKVKITEDAIIMEAVSEFQISLVEIASRSRRRPLPTARMFAWAIGIASGKFSKVQMGAWFGVSGPAVCMAMKQFKSQLAVDRHLSQRWIEFASLFPDATQGF